MARLSYPLVAVTLAWSGVALGQTPAPAPAPAAAPPAPAAATPAPAAAPAPPSEAKKPAILGTGPFWEAVMKGDAAYAARDFDGAITAYRQAVEKDPNNPMGHYRLGSAQFSKGNFDEAEQTWQAGLRFAKEDRIRAKLLFVLAALRERQRNFDESEARWKEYGLQAQKPEAKAFPATATERQKRITEWKQIEADSKAVRERIEKRLKETEESMRKSSK